MNEKARRPLLAFAICSLKEEQRWDNSRRRLAGYRYDTTGGRFKRSVSAFRNWLTAERWMRSLPRSIAI